MKPSTLAWVLIAAVLLLVGNAGVLAGIATDWAWFDATGFIGVFRTSLFTRVGLFVGGALLAFAVLQGNVALALRAVPARPLRLSRQFAEAPLAVWLTSIPAGRITPVLSTVIALMAGAALSTWWKEALLAVHGSSFGVADPILGRDVAFYVFVLPMLQIARGYALALAFLALIATVATYVARGGLRIDFGNVRGQTMVRGIEIIDTGRRHVAALVLVWLLVISAGIWLGRYTLMYAQHGLMAGPGMAEVTVTLPLIAVQTVVTVLASIALTVGLLRGRVTWLVGAGSTIVLASLVGSFLPDAYHRLVVLPNELVLEEPFLEHHITATRRAFLLDGIEERRLSGDARLERADIDANPEIIENIRLWDHRPLLETFSQVQEIRTYYGFLGVHNDRYVIDGRLRQTMLSPREMQPASLPPQARTWVNETMVYTHGYGVALGPVNVVTPEGLPELWIKDLPPEVEHPEALRIDEPAIYFGEATEGPVFVRTRNAEFDYPSGEESAFTTYEGKGGVAIGNLLWRSLWALRLQNSKVLLTSDLTPDSEVLLYRNVVERVTRIAPFLVLDHDPYMVVAEGRLVWILDAYTATGRYPYSHQVAGISYLRNSVKVTVDAYDGTTTFYAMDADDPVLKAWSSAFPGWLQPESAMPPSIRAHVRYPLDLFSLQAWLFGTYHMVDPQQFYNREDEWEVASVEEEGMSPYYTVMRIPGEQAVEYILMLPFVPRNKPNLAAWMVARSDGAHYGEALVYRFPKDKMVYGPATVAARFKQDAEIGAQVTLWDRQRSTTGGSGVAWGTLLVIPIGESLIYVQPLYLRASSGSIPELKRVLVSYEDDMAMEETLEKALAVLFGDGEAPPPEPRPTPAAGEDGGVDVTAPLAAQASAHWAAVEEAAARGDWEAFGAAMDRLGATLSQLAGEAPAAPPDGPN